MLRLIKIKGSLRAAFFINGLLTLLFLAFASSALYYSHRVLPEEFDDLPSFYWANQLTWQENQSPYQAQPFLSLSQQLERKIYPFLYPPPSLLIFSPFLLCSDYIQCKTSFTYLSAFLWILLTAFVYIKLSSHLTSRIALLVWLSSFGPILNTLITGQVNLLALFLISPLLYFSLTKQSLSNKPRTFNTLSITAGILFALAICLKLYLILLLLPLIMARQWRLCFSALFTLGAIGLVSILLLPSLWQDWIQLRLPYGGYGQRIRGVLTIPWNQSTNGFMIRAFLHQGILKGQGSGALLTYIINSALLMVSVYYSYKSVKSIPYDGLAISLCLFLLVITLIAPLTWLHHYVFIIPTVLLSFNLCKESLQQSYSHSNTAILILLLFSTTLISFPFVVNFIFPHYLQLSLAEQPVSLAYNLFLSTPMLASLSILLALCRYVHVKASTA